MGTALYDSFVAFAKANPRTPRSSSLAGRSWADACALGQAIWNRQAFGWNHEGGVWGPGAVDVGRASGPLNRDPSKAPVGAWHFWSNGRYGHVGRDLSGGGHDVGMFGTNGVRVKLAEFVGIQSADAYAQRAGGHYMGWATTYGGKTTPIPQTAGSGHLSTAQRRANATARRRLHPTSKSTHVGQGKDDLTKGTVGNFIGFIRGEHVNGSDIWFKGISGNYFHASGFEGGANVAGLPDLGTWGEPPAAAPAPAVQRWHVRIPEPWRVFGSEHNAYWNQHQIGTVGAGDYLITSWGNDGKPVEIQAPGQEGVRHTGRVWIGGRFTPAPTVLL